MDRQDIQFLIEMLGKLDDNQAKAGTDIKAWREEMASRKEKMDTETRAIQARTKAMRENMGASHMEMVAEIIPKRDADTMACQETEARQEEMRASRRETAAVIEPETEVKTMACQEMEAHQEEEPISADKKPKAAEQREVPVDDAEVMPVGEPKKKGRRD
jgi:hypothetical protein